MPATAEEKILANLIKHMVREGENPLTPMIDAYYLRRDESPHRLDEYTVPMRDRIRPGGRLSPSSVGGCERAAMFKFVNMEGRKVIDPDQQAVFDDGTWRHHRWQATFLDMEQVLGKKKFEVIKIEGKTRLPKLYVAGSYDVLVKIRGVMYVIDFKGANSWMWSWIAEHHAPLPSHILQLITYMRMRKVNKGMLFYEHKDRNIHQIFTTQYTREQWIEAKAWLERVIAHLEARTLPPKSITCASGNFEHERCPYARHCWGTNVDPRKVKKKAYKNFVGLKEAWKEGWRAIEEAEEAA